jgi:cytidylate kinase
MIITIAGLEGSGKTTVGKMLAGKLGYQPYSVGDLRGEIAARHGMTIHELNQAGETEPWTDREADDYLTELGRTMDDMVIDSRLGWYFIPDSFKLFVGVDPWVGAERVYKARRPDEPPYDSIEHALEMNAGRLASDTRRYRKHYGIEDHFHPDHFDLILDSSYLTPEQLIDDIIAHMNDNLEGTYGRP